ncbi:MAG: hypothetical protein Q8Q33_10405 [Chlamydiota bacterium]|nr:hypothetical protein [Chlamydiota bacterium]
MTLTNGMIKSLETYTYRQRFSKELTAYLKDRYSEEPWPYEYSEQDLFANVMDDIDMYFKGKLDTTIRTPVQKLTEQIEDLRELYCHSMYEIHDLNSYIDELHEWLWAHGLESSGMIHSDTHAGTYKELAESLPILNLIEEGDY